jgi:hypothetical protein
MDHHPMHPVGQETIMLWPASIESQRPAPRGEAVMTCAGRPDFLSGSAMNHEYQRWRG